MDPPELTHQANNITITYTSQLAKITTPEKANKILNIMCRLSSDGGVWITNNAWRELGFYEIFHHQVQDCQNVVIKSWGIRTTLGLISNWDCTLPKQLSTVNFPSLLFLCLDCNNIQSLHPLVHANMPTLTILHLNDNKITSLKPLTRGYFPQLRALELFGNNIIDYFRGGCLSQGFWPELTNLALNKPYTNVTNLQMTPRFHGLGYLCKLQTNLLQTIGIPYSSPEQELLKPILAKIRRKYDKIGVSQSAFAFQTVLQAKIAERKAAQQPQQNKSQSNQSQD